MSSEPYRVLYLDHVARPSGAELALWRMLASIDKEKIEPLVLLGENGAAAELILSTGAETHVLPLDDRVRELRKDSLNLFGLLHLGRFAAALAYALRVARFARRKRVDLIHTNTTKAHLYGTLAAWMTGIPVLWHVRDYFNESHFPKAAVRLLKWLVRVAPIHVICNSCGVLHELQLGEQTQKASVVLGGLTEAEFASIGPPAFDRPRSGPARVGIVGRLAPWKGQHVLIDAAAKVIAAGHDVHFDIVGAPLFGEEDYAERLRSQARDLGLEQRIHFQGFTSNVVGVMHELDILVHASTSAEPFGQVILEGMAAGLPVIATAAGGALEIVTHGENGLLTPMGDSGGLADSIMLLLREPETAQRMARCGYARAQKQFRAARVAKEIEGIYEGVRHSVSASRFTHRPRPSEMSAPTTEPACQRVLYLNHGAKASGGELALARLLGAIDRRRVLPIVLFGEEGPATKFVRELGVETHVLPMDPKIRDVRKDSLHLARLVRLGQFASVVSYARAVAAFAKKHKIAIIHTNTLKAHLYGTLAGRLAGVPTVWHLRDCVSHSYLPAAAVRLLRLLAYVGPSHVICVSQNVLQQIRPRASKGNAATVIWDGLTESELEQSPPVRETGWIDDIPRVGILGRLAPWKGQHVFLAAAAQVLGEGHRATFSIIGAPLFSEEEYEARLRAQAESLGISEHVRFHGFTRDVRTQLSNLDILVHASTTPEPFGQVIIEGMAAGLPVIASAGGGALEIITHRENGLLTPMNDAHALAEALTTLVRDAKEARRLGQAGLEHVRKVFRITHTARKVEAVYRHLNRRAHREEDFIPAKERHLSDSRAV